jgi:O-antigen/teichoic acid export membrane protein
LGKIVVNNERSNDVSQSQRRLSSTSISRQAGVFLLSLVIGSVLQLISSIIIARWLGPAGKGVVNLVLLIPSIGRLICSLGIDMAIVYYVGKGQYKPREILPVVIFWGLIVCVCISIIALSSFSFLEKTVFKGLTFPLFILGLIILFLRVLINYFISLARALQRIKQIAIIVICDRFGYVLLVVLFVILCKLGIRGAIFSFLTITCIVIILILNVLSDSFKLTDLWPKLRLNISSHLFNYGLRSYVGNIAQNVIFRLDVLIVNYFLGPAQVGIYTIAITLTECLLFIPRAVRFVFFPKVAALDKSSSLKTMPIIGRQTLLITTMIGIGLAIASFFGVPIVYGNEFKSAIQPILILLPGAIVLSLGWVISSFLNGRGLPHYVSYVTAVTLILKIILGLILIPKLNIAGAALVSSVSYAAFTVCSMVIVWVIFRTNPFLISVPKSEDFKRWRNIITRFVSRNK